MSLSKIYPGGGSEQAAALHQDSCMLDTLFLVMYNSGMVQLLLEKLEKSNVYGILCSSVKNTACAVWQGASKVMAQIYPYD